MRDLGPRAAQDFICDRLDGVSAERVDDEMHQIIVDLLRSDLPLDGDRIVRNLIAEMYWRLAFPNAKRDRENKEQAWRKWDEYLKSRIRKHHGSAQKADEQIADMMFKLGILNKATVDAVWARRAKWKKQKERRR